MQNLFALVDPPPVFLKYNVQDIDTMYQPKTIKRKVEFLMRGKLECIYCDSMLCYDMYGKKLYKTERKFGYESTLFYTKEFWHKYEKDIVASRKLIDNGLTKYSKDLIK